MTQQAKLQYAYFENLDRTIKYGLAIYLVIFFVSIYIILMGVDNTVRLCLEMQVLSVLVSGFIIVCVLLSLIYIIGKIHWLGKAHILLDTKFFGFLEKTNRIIFDELTKNLDINQSGIIKQLHPDEKTTLVKIIFSQLANNEGLFESLLRTNIFRFWIWYWVMLYGTFIFTFLTITSFFLIVMNIDSQIRTLFTINWILSAIHLTLSIIFGYRLMYMTKVTVNQIIKPYESQISDLLSVNLQKHFPRDVNLPL